MMRWTDPAMPAAFSVSVLMHYLRLAAAGLLILLVRFYQAAIRPLLIGNCKFLPSCSDYFIQAVREWGPWRGGWLGVRRIARCHPFGKGGIDPVPRKGE